VDSWARECWRCGAGKEFKVQSVSLKQPRKQAQQRLRHGHTTLMGEKFMTTRPASASEAAGRNRLHEHKSD